MPNQMGDAGVDSDAWVPPDAPNEPPEFEGIRSVAPSGVTSLQVTWAPATDDRTAEEDLRYRVYVASASQSQNFGVATVESPPGATSLLIAGLSERAEYHIVVRAVDADDAEDNNLKELVGVPQEDSQAPQFSGIVNAETVNATSVRISWQPAVDDKTPAEGLRYAVRWSALEGGAVSGRLGAISIPGATSVVVSGLPAAETQFYFNVRALDAAGNTDSNINELAGKTGVDTTPPTFGGCASAGVPGATKANVTWLPARDDVELPENIRYNVYAFTAPPDDETPFGKPAQSFIGVTQGEVTGLNNDTTYYFVCRAEDRSGNEDQNFAYRSLTTLKDGVPPTFGGITQVEVSSTSAELRWDQAVDDQTPQGRIVYLVYQGTSIGAALSGLPVMQSAPGASNITLFGLQSNQPHYWVVRAVDEAGNESNNTAESPATTKVSFARDIEPIFAQHCATAGCHIEPSPAESLNLYPGYAYGSIIQDSVQMSSTLKRVNTSSANPEDSYLYRKIDPAAGAIDGSAMPLGQAPLSAAQKKIIADWIKQGAEQN